MPRYVIERQLPGAGALSAAEIRAIAQKSNQILIDMGGDVQWEHSYVTNDTIFCVYLAPDESRVREHARRGDFPVDAVHRVVQIIDPATAES
jgi:hypothetical protein